MPGFKEIIEQFNQGVISIGEFLAWLDDHPWVYHRMKVVQAEPELYVVECPKCHYKKQLYRAPSGVIEGSHLLRQGETTIWHVWEIGGTLGPGTFSLGVEKDEQYI